MDFRRPGRDVDHDLSIGETPLDQGLQVVADRLDVPVVDEIVGIDLLPGATDKVV